MLSGSHSWQLLLNHLRMLRKLWQMASYDWLALPSYLPLPSYLGPPTVWLPGLTQWPSQEAKHGVVWSQHSNRCVCNFNVRDHWNHRSPQTSYIALGFFVDDTQRCSDPRGRAKQFSSIMKKRSTVTWGSTHLKGGQEVTSPTCLSCFKSNPVCSFHH